MKYLSREDILEIHSIIIDETGGSHGVRDSAALRALEALPRQSAFGKELYQGVYKKAAVYVRNLIFSHPFIDGNKRTAMASAGVFLEDNGYEISAKEGEVEHCALEIIKKRLDIEDIASWLKRCSKKIGKQKTGRKVKK